MNFNGCELSLIYEKGKIGKFIGYYMGNIKFLYFVSIWDV